MDWGLNSFTARRYSLDVVAASRALLPRMIGRVLIINFIMAELI
jgi:hypothetical protein